MLKGLSVEEAKARLTDLLEAALRGEAVSITVDDQQAVQLVPVVEAPRVRRPFGSAKGLIDVSEDFDAPLEDFEEYMR